MPSRHCLLKRMKRLPLDLPFPPRALHPNSRLHWSRVAPVKAQYRFACKVLAQNAVRKGLEVPSSPRIVLRLDFYPPNRRRRDDDGLVAAFKAGRDGLADALKIDDSRFKVEPVLHREVVRDGLVRVTLLPLTEPG